MLFFHDLIIANEFNTDDNKSHEPSSHEINREELKNKKIIDSKDVILDENKECHKYMVQEGENLIHILRKLNYYPIYGEKGYLSKTMQINSKLPNHNYILQEGEFICLVEKKKEDESIDLFAVNSFHSFYFEGGLKYLRLIESDPTTGTSATLLSRPIASTEVGFNQNWSPSFKSFLGMNYMISEIMQSDNSVVIGDSITHLINYFVGANYKINDAFYTESIISYGDILVVRAVSDNALKIEKMSNAKFKLLGGLTFLDLNNFLFKGEIGLLLNSKFNNEIYDADFGKGYEWAFLVAYPNNGWELRSKIYYSHYSTKVQPVIFDYTEVGLLLRLTVDLE